MAGITINIKVIESVPSQVFDDAAIKSFRQWRYAKLVVGGVPKMQRDIKVELAFKL